MAMAAEVEHRIEAIKASAGQSGEARMLVMAALTMADDLYELKRQAASQSGSPDPKLGRRLSRMAKRAEDIAEDLESP